MIKISVVDYWMIHRLLDALRHLRAVDGVTMNSSLYIMWEYAKGLSDDG